MLNQEKTGNYIAEKRKQMGMTQKQLAEQVGITDKAVSKWERGKSIPDSMVMEELCRTLQITMNEFFSGEDIQEEYYSDRAEENIRDLMEESSEQKKSSKIVVICLAAGFAAILIGLYATSMYFYGLSDIIAFIDIPSLFFIIGIVLVILVLAGAVIPFVKAFIICFGKAEAGEEQLRGSAGAVKITLVSNLLVGAFIFAGQVILMLSTASETEEVYRKLSVQLVTIWYSVLLDLLLIPVLYRLQRKV